MRETGSKEGQGGRVNVRANVAPTMKQLTGAHRNRIPERVGVMSQDRSRTRGNMPFPINALCSAH